MNNNLFQSSKFNAGLSFVLAFISYLAFCIVFTVQMSFSPTQWVVLAFILVFGIGFFVGAIKQGTGDLCRNSIMVLLIGNIVISLMQDPAHLFSITSSMPAYQTASYILAGIAGVLAFVALIILVLAFSVPSASANLGMVLRILFIVIAALYFGAGVAYLWADAYSWLMLGLFTATFVYIGFYHALPLLSGKKAA